MDKNKNGKIIEINTNINNNFIISLPYEILFLIFQFLNPLDIFRYVSKVNKLFNTISKDYQLLNNIIKNEKNFLINIPLKLRPEDTSPFELYKTATQIKINTRHILQKIFSIDIVEFYKPTQFLMDHLNKDTYNRERVWEIILDETEYDIQKWIQQQNIKAQERIWPLDVLEYLHICDGFNIYLFSNYLPIHFYGYRQVKTLLREGLIFNGNEKKLITKDHLVIEIGDYFGGTDSQCKFFVCLEQQNYGYIFCVSVPGFITDDDSEIEFIYFVATSLLAFLQHLEELLTMTRNKQIREDDFGELFCTPMQ